MAARETAGLKCPPLPPKKSRRSREAKAQSLGPTAPWLALQGPHQSRAAQAENGSQITPTFPEVQGGGGWEGRAAPFLSEPQTQDGPEEERGAKASLNAFSTPAELWPALQSCDHRTQQDPRLQMHRPGKVSQPPHKSNQAPNNCS